MPRDFEYEDFTSVEVKYTSKANIPFEQIIQERNIDPFTNEAELKVIVEDYLHKHGFKYAELTEESVRSLSIKLTTYFVQRINGGE